MISSPESDLSVTAVTMPRPSAALTLTLTRPKSMYLRLTSVGASPAFHTPTATPSPPLAKSRRRRSWTVSLSICQKSSRALWPQSAVLKLKDALPAKAGSGGQPVHDAPLWSTGVVLLQTCYQD